MKAIRFPCEIIIHSIFLTFDYSTRIFWPLDQIVRHDIIFRRSDLEEVVKYVSQVLASLYSHHHSFNCRLSSRHITPLFDLFFKYMIRYCRCGIITTPSAPRDPKVDQADKRLDYQSIGSTLRKDLR